QRWLPEVFRSAGHGTDHAPAADEMAAAARTEQHRSLRHALKVVATFLVLWLVPLAALYAWRGGADTLVLEMWFFTQAAFVTFGGAYAVLSYIADVAVNGYGWLTAGEMVRGLGLAESTPGPLIMVTEYVGFVAAWKTAPADVPRPSDSMCSPPYLLWRRSLLFDDLPSRRTTLYRWVPSLA